MITVLLVLSGVWGVMKRDSFGEFFGSAMLAAFEISFEAALLVRVFA